MTNNVSAIVNDYGSKNLLKIVCYITNGSNYNGVVITFNDDGSITCVGRSTAAISLQISDNIYLDQNKQYIMSGTTTGSSSTYFLQYSNNRDSAISIKTEERVFTPYNYTTYPNQNAYIQIKSGVDINTTFYPMIRDANIKDNTFVPYSMTNLQITKSIDRGNVSVVSDGVKTYSQLMQDLYARADMSKITYNAKLRVGNGYFSLNEKYSTNLVFQKASSSSAYGEIVATYQVSNTNPYVGEAYQGVEHDKSSTVLGSGTAFILYY